MTHQEVDNSFSRKRNLLRNTSIASVATILLASCTDNRSGRGFTEKTLTPKFPVSSVTRPTAPSVSVKPGPIETALSAYGKDLNQKHVATIAMNTCVAWQNINDGITVTYNPGLVQVHGSNAEQHGEVLVWGNRVQSQGYPQSSLIVSDGPGIFYTGQQVENEIEAQVVVVYFGGTQPKSPMAIDSRVSERHLNDTLTSGTASDIGFYRDDITHQPVIHSETTQGTLDVATIMPICTELRN